MKHSSSESIASEQADHQSVSVNCAFGEMVPVEKVIPNPRNPNRHPEAQIAALAKIIAHQGWRAPVVVSRRSGFVVSGHGRLEAALKLGLSKVPVDYQDFKTEADEWAHLVADNRIAELAEMDTPALKEILADLKEADFDVGLAGFDAPAMDQLFNELREPAPPEDFDSVDEGLPTEHECPKCHYRWSGKSA